MHLFISKGKFILSELGLPINVEMGRQEKILDDFGEVRYSQPTK